jgi:hypothetical protein
MDLLFWFENWPLKNQIKLFLFGDGDLLFWAPEEAKHIFLFLKSSKFI